VYRPCDKDTNILKLVSMCSNALRDGHKFIIVDTGLCLFDFGVVIYIYISF
jgi:hypothetical protein